MNKKYFLFLITLSFLFLLFIKVNNVYSYGECFEYGGMSYYDSFSNSCKCMSGYVFGKDIFGKTQCISPSQACKNQYGTYATNELWGSGCKCMSGYVFGKDIFGKTTCVSGNSVCIDQYGINANYNSISDKCECRSGYEFTIKKDNSMECVSCFSRYGTNSSYDYIKKECKCNDGYTLNENNQCIKKQNNVYFLLEKLDLNNRKAIVKSDYDQSKYLIEYDHNCYDSAIQRYLNKKIVINLGTNFILEKGNKIVLYDDNATCDIKSVKLSSTFYSICETNYILQNNRCIKIICPLNSAITGNQCYCNQGYKWNISEKACIKIPTKTNIPEIGKENIFKEESKEEQISKEIGKENIFKEESKEEQISKEIIIREKDKEDTKIKEDKEELEIEEIKKIEKSKKGFLSIALNNTRGFLSRSFNNTRKFFSKLSNWL